MKSLSFQNGHMLNVYDNGSYDLMLGSFGLTRCLPAIDGEKIQPVRVDIQSVDSDITVVYNTDKMDLQLTFTVSESHLNIKAKIIHLKNCDAIEKVALFDQAYLNGYEKVLAHGYFSWDQSDLIDGKDLETAESNGLAAAIGKNESMIAGFLKHDTMFQLFRYAASGNQTTLACEAYLEGKDLSELKEITFADLVVFTDPVLDEGQKKWARLTAENLGIKLTKTQIRGWCSWYYNYFWMSGDLIEEYTQKFAPFKDEMNLQAFVVDANYFAHLGDWLETCDRYPKGMEHYAKVIQDAGYTPGIWIGPWMVGDRSRVYREHPEWLCKDENGNPIEFMSPLGEDNVWGFRDKLHYCLDTSHPDAFDYLRNVFHTLRKWGYKYYKTDFMYWGSMDRFEGGWYHEGQNSHNFIWDKEKRPVIRRHMPGKTRMEYFIDVLKMIREEIGEESIWAGCGQPIWASIGYVDSIRISRDVGARWVAHNSPKELLGDLQLRNFTNHIFYEADPDCMLLRHFEHKLTDDEVTSLALYMGVAQGMVLTSDPIHLCKRERIDLFKFIQGENDKITFNRPLLAHEDWLIAYTGKRHDNDLYVLHCFNRSDDLIEKPIPFASLGIPNKCHVVEWKKKGSQVMENAINISLAPHQTRLFYLKETPFESGWQPAKITG